MATMMKNIAQIWRCANLYRAEAYGEEGIGNFRDGYLINICRNPGITQDKLASLLYVHKSNVARQLCWLESNGFVTRKADDKDKRNTLVFPTQKAYDYFPSIREVHSRWEQQLCKGFDAEQLLLLQSFLERMAENARNLVTKENADDEKS